MNDDEAWETASASWPDIIRETPEIRQAFDAGRASRDAEVWDGEWRTIPQSEEESRRVLKTWTKAELIDALTSARQLGLQKNEFWRSQMTARADAAEAVIAALQARLTTAEAIISRARHCVREEYARDQVMAVLQNPLPPMPAAAPQTVLAERDRKNRFDAWDEGATAGTANQLSWDGWRHTEPEITNPYTEKEQSNGNN